MWKVGFHVLFDIFIVTHHTQIIGIAPARNLDVKEISDGVITIWEQPMFVQNITKIKYGITVTGSGLAIFTANNIEDLQYNILKILNVIGRLNIFQDTIL